MPTKPKVSEHSPTRQATRERILDSAARVVRSRGLAHATTKEIARAAGLSEAALYKYFRDKEELVLLLMQERLPEWMSVLTRLLERVGQGTVAGNLEPVVFEAIRFYGDFVPMGAALFAEPEILGKLQRRMRRDDLGPHRANEAVAEYARREQQAGRIAKRIDPDAAAGLLLGSAFQRAFLLRFLGRPLDDETERTFARQLVRTALSGLGD